VVNKNAGACGIKIDMVYHSDIASLQSGRQVLGSSVYPCLA
jgi:hypothetical protein